MVGVYSLGQKNVKKVKSKIKSLILAGAWAGSQYSETI